MSYEDIIYFDFFLNGEHFTVEDYDEDRVAVFCAREKAGRHRTNRRSGRVTGDSASRLKLSTLSTELST